MSEPRITLVRHGRSAHVHAGWVDLDGFRRWRERYEAAGIDPNDPPPRDLHQLAASAGALVASDLRRAIESAQLLAPGKHVTISPLLRELDLTPPNVPFRMPLAGWALAYMARWLRNGLATPAEKNRIDEAARWLTSLADTHATVVAVTHHSLRGLLAEALTRDGWTSTIPRRKSSHWSAWTFDRSKTARRP